MNDGQVTVEADAGQEEDSTVAIQGEQGAGDLAESNAKNPLVGILHRKQWEGEGQQQVRDGQVKEEGVCQREGAGPRISVLVPSDHTQHQNIAHNCQHKHKAVHNWDVLLGKTINVTLLTWGSNAA